MTRAARAVGATLVAALGFGCHRSPEGGAPERAAAPAPSASAAVDHLAPGELLEGSEEAFDLLLPRDFHVEGRFVDVVYAEGHAALHPTVAYLRARLTDGALREGDSAATFEHVRVLRKLGPDLRVSLTTVSDGVRVEVRDQTPPRLAPKADEAARWKSVGLTPNGHLTDPTHLD